MAENRWDKAQREKDEQAELEGAKSAGVTFEPTLPNPKVTPVTQAPVPPVETAPAAPAAPERLVWSWLHQREVPESIAGTAPEKSKP